MVKKMLKVGLIINPIAGVGGKAGLKGSDGESIQKKALDRGGTLESGNKTKISLHEILEEKDNIKLITAYGSMGEYVVKDLGFQYELTGDKKEITSSSDTENVAKILKRSGIDILVFAGGDGTARNIYNSVGLSIPCIGIPAGVKIHSAVYAINPKSAGLVLKRFINNTSDVHMIEREVMDIDEELFRLNILKAKLHGYLLVPHLRRLMQSPKSSFRHETHDIAGIAEEIIDQMEYKDKDVCYIFSTGSTTYKILKHMGIEGSLLGIDIIKNKKLVLLDVSEKVLFDYIKTQKEIVLIITPIGGQGHIFGRGNQQLSPRIIKLISKDNLWIVACADKIYNLKDNILLVDTSDPKLDIEITGYQKVIVGWQKRIICKIEHGCELE